MGRYAIQYRKEYYNTIEEMKRFVRSQKMMRRTEKMNVKFLGSSELRESFGLSGASAGRYRRVSASMMLPNHA